MKFFNTTKKYFKEGKVYAVHKGVYLGHLLFYVEYNNTTEQYCFISLKDMKNMCVPAKDALEGLTKDLLRITDIDLPKEYRTLCLKQYNFNIDNLKKRNIIEDDEDPDTRLQ
jgi:hypothetical protein